jgi:putative addiction module killer protein
LRKLKDRRAAARVLVRTIVVAGNPGDVKPVGDGISEFRIAYGPGYRAYYYLQEGRRLIVLLCGGDKSSQQHGAGAPASADSLEIPGSPRISGVLGLLASAAGDQPTAVEHLARQLAAAESWANSPEGRCGDTADAAFWRGELDRAHRLH